MPTRGLKRKYSEWEESVLDGHLSFQTDSYSFFRQSLLNISLEKFNKGRTMLEPSLRRYVLIANTLRVIQEEICHENPYPLPVVDAGLFRGCDASFGNDVGPFFPQDMENGSLPSGEDDFTVSAAIASILKELESVLDEGCPQGLQRTSGVHESVAKLEPHNGSQTLSPGQPPIADHAATMKEEIFHLDDSTEIELIKELVLAAACSEVLPELPVAMDTSLLEEVPAEASSTSNSPQVTIAMDTSSPDVVTTQAPLEQSVSGVLTKELKSSEAVFGGFEIMSSSYLNGVSFDDPFSDIDTSVFEKEMPLLGAPPSNRLLSSEELWFPPSCNSPTYASSHGVRDSNELDNIIEILVGS
ncbi:SERTA domain-containing protein 2-like [Mixophyes fleayi]|uniref:SERTA domain-containing protein 2-like n=1 Tax=Mixophyes fleayi TaxID=3061075 RepID=UPI003F4E25A7